MSAELLEFPKRIETAEDPQRVLENSVVRLLKSKPFYGHLLLGFRRRLGHGTHATGVTLVNGTPTLNVDPQQFSVFNFDEQQALLEHALKHLLHLHPVRGRGQHRLTWDVATDLAINPSIDKMPLAAPQPHAFRLEAGLAAEEYARFLQQDFDIGTLEGEGLGDAGQGRSGQRGQGLQENLDEQSSPRPVDDHRIWSEADGTPECLAEQGASQRDDLQAVTLNDVVTTLDVDPSVSLEQEQTLVASIGSLPRDLRFGLVKALV